MNQTEESIENPTRHRAHTVMTERWYRLLQGIYLFIALYYEQDLMMYVFMGILALEAVSNVRLPMLLPRFSIGKDGQQNDGTLRCVTFSLDSERLLRIVVVLLLFLSYILFPEPIWFLPWFVAAMLFMAGITNICPMVMMFQHLGFR